MPMQYPLINGLRYDWTSISIMINGNRRELGATSLDFDDPLEGNLVFGNHAQSLGSTRGTQSCSASVEMLKAEAEQWVRDMGPGYKEKYFPIVVRFSENGTSSEVRLEGCRIKADPFSGAQGGDALKVKFDLMVLRVIRDGIQGVANPLV